MTIYSGTSSVSVQICQTFQCLHRDAFRYICEFYIGPRQVKHGITLRTKFAQTFEDWHEDWESDKP